jgi:DNA-binding NarL/FixJ family response regulator
MTPALRHSAPMTPSDSPTTAIRVVLADDHDLVRSGIKALLRQMPGIEVVAEARDGEELLAVLGGVQPDVVMTDISMPVMDGIQAIEKIGALYPAVKVLVLSMYDGAEYVKRAVASGACGYLMKDAPARELEQALRGVVATGSYYSQAVTRLLLQKSEELPTEQLTERQLEILKLIAQGLSAKEIAFQLGLSSKTVDVHRARIMERLQLADVASLTRYAIRHGLVKA